MQIPVSLFQYYGAKRQKRLIPAVPAAAVLVAGTYGWTVRGQYRASQCGDLTAVGRSARHVLTGIVGRRGARVKVAGAAVESTACAGKTAASDRTSARNRAFIDLETLNLIG